MSIESAEFIYVAPLGLWEERITFFYTHSEKTPKQKHPTGLKCGKYTFSIGIVQEWNVSEDKARLKNSPRIIDSKN